MAHTFAHLLLQCDTSRVSIVQLSPPTVVLGDQSSEWYSTTAIFDAKDIRNSRFFRKNALTTSMRPSRVGFRARALVRLRVPFPDRCPGARHLALCPVYIREKFAPHIRHGHWSLRLGRVHSAVADSAANEVRGYKGQGKERLPANWAWSMLFFNVVMPCWVFYALRAKHYHAQRTGAKCW